jgi:hypothetical protein
MPFKPSLCLALLFLGIFFALTMGSMPAAFLVPATSKKSKKPKKTREPSPPPPEIDRAGEMPAGIEPIVKVGRCQWRIRATGRATVIANLDAL